LTNALIGALGEHHCRSVHQLNWGGLSNGLLLQKAQREFDVFLTADTNLSFQQNLTSFDIGVIILEAISTRLVDTVKLMPEVLRIVTMIQPGQVVHIKKP
jgi:hypothetical protein